VSRPDEHHRFPLPFQRGEGPLGELAGTDVARRRVGVVALGDDPPPSVSARARDRSNPRSSNSAGFPA